MEEEDDEAVLEFRWNLKMLLRNGYPDGIGLRLLTSTYRRYFDKTVLPSSILVGSTKWEDVFAGVKSLAITFTISKNFISNTKNPRLRDFIFIVNIGPARAGIEEDASELASVMSLVSYPNYVAWKAKQTVSPTNLTVEAATSSTGTGTGEGQCHLPTSTVLTLGSPIQINGVRSASIGSSTLARTPELNLDSQTQRLFPGPGVITRRRSALFSSNGEGSSVSTSTRTQTPTKEGKAVGRGRGRGRPPKTQTKRTGPSKKETDSESELDSSSENSELELDASFPPATANFRDSRPVATVTGPFQPVATEVVLNSPPNKRKGSLKKDTDSESESDSSSESESDTSYTPAALAVTVNSQESRPVTTVIAPIQPVATEIVPNIQPVTTVMIQNLPSSAAILIPVTAGTIQNAELIAPVVRPASEQEDSEPERTPIIVKVESARTPTTQPIQDFIDLTQDSDDEGENETNRSSIPVNTGNSTLTLDWSSNIHGPSASNVSFATPSHAESVAAENCANIVHVVAQPFLPVEFVRVKPERFENVAEQSPVPLISALENAVVSCRLNVEPNQNNGDRQDEPVIPVPSVVVKVETNQSENDHAAEEAEAVPTSRDDQGQGGLQLNIREVQPPMFTELLIESRPIKDEDEDMSAAGIPLGNTMGAETQETTSLRPPYSAVVNSGTSFDLNLTPTTVNTVKNSVGSMKLPPTPPSTVVTALESNSQSSTPIKTEPIPTPVETSPMASSAATTLAEVSTTTIDSGEFVHENVNSPATQLPVSPIFPSTPLRINVDHEFNIFRSQSGDVNKNQPSLLQGTNNFSSNDSPTPEQVMKLIEDLKADGGLKRTDGTVAQFTTFHCRSIRVGSYSRAMKSSHNLVTISDVGILFYLPHSQTDAVTRCAVPADQVLSVTAHCSAKLPLLVVTTSPRYAVWLRGRLGMTDDPAMPNYFCPLKGGESQKYLILKMDKFSIMDIVFINRIYKRVLIELDYEKAKALETTLEDHTQTQGDDQVDVELNNREPQPPISTESPIESRAIKVEDMSAAGIPLGDMMGAETQETAVGNSQTPLNLPPAAANTVMNSAREKADSDPDWELEPGPSRRSSKNGRRSSGNIKRPTTAGTPMIPTKRGRRDSNTTTDQSGTADTEPSNNNNVDDDSREVEVRITGILGDRMSEVQFEEIVKHIVGWPQVELKLTKRLLNNDFNTPNEWIAVPVSTTELTYGEMVKGNKLRGIYRSIHVPNTTSFMNYFGHWVKCRVENFHLPTNTIVYGEFVEQIKSEVITFDVIDCACLLGRDIRELPIEERRNVLQIYCDSNSNKVPGQTVIRLKTIYGMVEMKDKIFDRLHTFTTRGEKIRCLADPLKGDDFNAVRGIAFFQSTFQSLSTNFSFAMDSGYFWLFESDLAFAPSNSISIEENDEEVTLWHFLEKIRASRAPE